MITLLSKLACTKVSLSLLNCFGGNAVIRLPVAPGRLLAMNLHVAHIPEHLLY